MNKNMYESKLAVIAADPKLIGRLCGLIGSMPNIDLPTMGEHIWQDTLAECDGWRLQKNKLTGHCRILEPSDNRKAWGVESAMMNALKRLQPRECNSNLIYCHQCRARVPDGRFCKECRERL